MTTSAPPQLIKAIEVVVDHFKSRVTNGRDRANFDDTAARVARYFTEAVWPERDVWSMVAELLTRTFPADSDEMVIITGIHTSSVCPHHLMPIHYEMDIAYVPMPGPANNVLGLSKIPRIADALSHRAVLQETLASNIADVLFRSDPSAVPCSMISKGSAVCIRGYHTCMSERGVKAHASRTIITAVRGILRTNVATKNEFLAHIHHPNNH